LSRQRSAHDTVKHTAKNEHTSHTPGKYKKVNKLEAKDVLPKKMH